jgi:hypothetical protein
MFSDQTTVWKLPIRSGRPDIKENPATVHRAREFCFKMGWAGIGWELENVSDHENRPGIYEDALLHSPRTDIKLRSARTAHRSFAYSLRENDLVWCRAEGNIYWIGRIIGGWQYRCTGYFAEFDLYQVRKCEWRCLGPSDLVPGPVKNAFAGRGAAFTRILREADEARASTVRLWYSLGGDSPNKKPFAGAARLAALGHDDLEDLVLLYLQFELGWRIILSSAKRSTPFTECVLRNDIGQRAYVQVKSGLSGLNGMNSLPDEIDTMYVFNGNEDYSWVSDPRIRPIGRNDLLQFVTRAQNLLPPQVRSVIA